MQDGTSSLDAYLRVRRNIAVQLEQAGMTSGYGENLRQRGCPKWIPQAMLALIQSERFEPGAVVAPELRPDVDALYLYRASSRQLLLDYGIGMRTFTDVAPSCLGCEATVEYLKRVVREETSLTERARVRLAVVMLE